MRSPCISTPGLHNCQGFPYRLAASLDRALNIALQQSKSSAQHVYKVESTTYQCFVHFTCQAVPVTGIPMYGYHPRQHSFIKGSS